MRNLREEVSPQQRAGKLSSLRRTAIIVAFYLIGWLVLNVVTKNPQGALEVSLWYPPSGLSFALLLVCGVRYAPAMVFTTLLQYLLFSGNVG